MKKSTRKLITLSVAAIALVAVAFTLTANGNAQASPKVYASSYQVQDGDGKWNVCAAITGSDDHKLLNDCAHTVEIAGDFEPGATIRAKYTQPEVLPNWGSAIITTR